MKKVLVAYAPIGDAFDELKQKYEVKMPEEGIWGYDDIYALIPEYDALLSDFSMKVDARMMDHAPRLKIISNYAVGFNNIDVAYAMQKGIAVANTPDPVIEPTAELAFGLMLDAARRITECDRKLHDKSLVWGPFNDMGVNLYGKTLGIIGMGRIGQAVARRAVAFGMKVVYHNRRKLPQTIEAKYGATYLPLDELYAVADFVSLNAPLTDDTYHLIDAHAFSLMKKNCILVNTARGPEVDEKALAEALRTKRILGAGLDVYEYEPQISEELLSLPNVVLTPHKGTATMEGRIAMAKYAAQNIMSFFEGKPFARVN